MKDTMEMTRKIPRKRKITVEREPKTYRSRSQSRNARK
jgi:hypothetical protein